MATSVFSSRPEIEAIFRHLIDMNEGQSSNQRVAFSVALALTWIAGVVDAIGYLSFAKIYTANMSGNSVALGIAVGEQSWATALFRFWPVLSYVAGLLIGRLLLEVGARLQISRIATFVFLLESMLLALAAWTGNFSNGMQHRAEGYAAIGMLALAMGAQNAALTRFSTVTLHSGFVTGTLLKANSEFVKTLTSIWDDVHAGQPLLRAVQRTIRQDHARLSVFLWVTWVCYVLGAIAGTLGAHAMRTNSLAIAIAGLVLLMGIDLRQPLAVQDEQQQDKNT